MLVKPAGVPEVEVGVEGVEELGEPHRDCWRCGSKCVQSGAASRRLFMMTWMRTSWRGQRKAWTRYVAAIVLCVFVTVSVCLRVESG